jgi:hypothetical protein
MATASGGKRVRTLVKIADEGRPSVGAHRYSKLFTSTISGALFGLFTERKEKRKR